MPARGTVERFSEAKGYGYIRPADGGGVLFFHRAAVVDKTGPLEKGDEVVYVAVRTKKGLKVARDVGKARAAIRPSGKNGRAP
jgi:cold shock CspA family protein